MAFGATIPFSLAVTPQQGWYICGEYDDYSFLYGNDQIRTEPNDYWVIDTHLGLDFWTADLWGGRESVGDLSTVPDVRVYGEWWRGYSQIPWRIDNDWFIQVHVESLTLPEGSKQIGIFGFDVSRAVNIYEDVTYNPSSSGHRLAGYSWTNFNESTCYFYTADALNIASVNSGPNKYFTLKVEDLQYAPTEDDVGNYTDCDGTDINNLVLGVIPLGAPKSCAAKVAFRFLVPKDKAPAGMQYGDEWPKLRSIPVTLPDGSLTEWAAPYYENLETESLLTDPNMIKPEKDKLDAAGDKALHEGLTIGDDSSMHPNNVWDMLSALGLTGIIVWLCVAMFVITLIRRGLS